MYGRRFWLVSALATVILVTAGCSKNTSTTSSSESDAATTQKNKNMEGVRSFMAGMAAGDTTVVDSLIAENFNEHQQMAGVGAGPAGLKALIREWHTAFPDMQITVNEMSADSDKVWVYSTMSGTMKGPLMGMKPTGKSFRVDAFDLIRIENGKAVEHWGVSDDASMIHQLGITMPSAPGSKRS